MVRKADKILRALVRRPDDDLDGDDSFLSKERLDEEGPGTGALTLDGEGQGAVEDERGSGSGGGRGRLRMRADIVMQGDEYAGVVTQRGKLRGQEDWESQGPTLHQSFKSAQGSRTTGKGKASRRRTQGGTHEEARSSDGDTSEQGHSEDERGDKRPTRGLGERPRRGGGGRRGRAESETDGEGDEKDEDDYDDYVDDDEDDDDDDDSDDETGYSEKRRNSRKGRRGSDDDDRDDHDNDDDYDDDDEDDNNDGEGDDNDDDLQAEIDALQEEQSSLVSSVTARHRAELVQASATSHQVALINHLTEWRIKMERGLAAGRRLPPPQLLGEYVQVRPTIEEGYSAAGAAALTLLNDLLAAREVVLSYNTDYADVLKEVTSRKRKRSDDDDNESAIDIVDSMWEVLTAGSDTLWKVAGSALNSAHQSSHLRQGLKARQLKALNHSLTAQIERALLDKDRGVKRARMYRGEGRLLGRRLAEGKRKSASGGGEEDPEVFDDSDFYHTLLKDLIGSAETVDASQLGAQFVALQKLKGKKIRRPRGDSQASGGRNTRYEVQPNLVHFMTAKEVPTEVVPVNELFASLFGA